MMRKEKHIVLFNPAAGGGKARALAPSLFHSLREMGLDLEIYETKEAGNAIALTRDAFQSGERNFIAVGGDGTSFEVINGLYPQGFELNAPPRLTILPVGTGNSFLRDFSNQGVSHFLKKLQKGLTRPCDVIELTHALGKMFFINILSFGFVADVGKTRESRYRRFGELGYVLSVLENLKNLQAAPWKIIIDGERTLESDIVFFSINNSQYTGGRMRMAPDANPSDGLVDIVWLKRISRYKLLSAFPKIFSGTHTQMKDVETTKAQSIQFNIDHEVNIMIDGEIKRILPKNLLVHEKALEISA